MKVTREDIAAVINDAGLDVDATEVQPDTLHPGMAWPEHVGFDPAGLCVYAHEWSVKVVLPAGHLQSTTGAADAWGEDIANALMTIGEVGRCEDVEIPVGDSNLRALSFELLTS